MVHLVCSKCCRKCFHFKIPILTNVWPMFSSASKLMDKGVPLFWFLFVYLGSLPSICISVSSCSAAPLPPHCPRHMVTEVQVTLVFCVNLSDFMVSVPGVAHCNKKHCLHLERGGEQWGFMHQLCRQRPRKCSGYRNSKNSR